jgi:hypothetical protein
MGADVLRMNISAKNPPQRKAAYRYSKHYFFLPSLLHPDALDNHETNNQKVSYENQINTSASSRNFN